MFKKIFIDLCNERKESPTAVCKALGLSAATFSCWTDESIPRRATLQRMADYFDVSIDILLGKEKRPTAEAVGNDDQLFTEAEQLMGSLSPARQEEAMRYLRYLASQEGKDTP